jgi:hypothetical protein
MRYSAYTLAVGLLFTFPPVYAADDVSVTAQDPHAEVLAQITTDGETINQACGSKIAFSIDWTSLKNEDTADKSIRDYCMGPLSSALDSYCSESSLQKAKIQKLKTLTCAYSKTGNTVLVIKGSSARYNFIWSKEGAETAILTALRKDKS